MKKMILVINNFLTSGNVEYNSLPINNKRVIKDYEIASFSTSDFS